VLTTKQIPEPGGLKNHVARQGTKNAKNPNRCMILGFLAPFASLREIAFVHE
jgi:hypothetical protein